MADIVEVSSWETGIYQIEQTDPVLGGPPNIATGEGLTNVPTQQLANRTVYLKGEIASVAAELASAQFVEEISVSGVTPLIRMTETDEGVATDQAGMIMLTGSLFIQAESGIVRFTDMAGSDMTLLTVKFGGVDQPILHAGMIATAAQIRDKTPAAPVSMDKAYEAAISVELVAGPAITFDMDAAINGHVTLDQNSTLAIINVKESQVGRIEVKQPAVGGPFTLAFDASCVHPNQVTPELTTTASAKDILRFEGLVGGSALVVLAHGDVG